MKKIICIALALVMVLGLASTAFAAEAKNDSITITNAVPGEVYDLYKLFDLVVNNEQDPSAYSYTINSAWEAFFASKIEVEDESGETVTTTAGEYYLTISNGYVTGIRDAAALAAAAEAYAVAHNVPIIKSIEATGNTVVFDGLANGYYLITSTLGTKAMTETTPDKNDVTINEKNPTDTIEKEVKEDSTGTYGKENDAQVGDTVEFKSEATLNPNTTNVKIYDAMDAGLTYNNDVKIDGLTKGEEYTVATDVEGYTFVITFTQDYLDTLTEATTLTLTYTAVLNENAVVKGENGIAIVDQYNKTKITYGNKQSVEDKTKTTTHTFTVNKYGDKIEENLAGAVFSLKKAGVVVPLVKLDDQNYRVATAAEIAAGGTTNTFITTDAGDVVIWGLDTDADYTLEEIEAPEGYNKLADEVKITVNADNTGKADIKNNTGTELPSTGGIGTTIFYILGAALAICAVVVLVTRRRMSSEG